MQRAEASGLQHLSFSSLSHSKTKAWDKAMWRMSWTSFPPPQSTKAWGLEWGYT